MTTLNKTKIASERTTLLVMGLIFLLLGILTFLFYFNLPIYFWIYDIWTVIKAIIICLGLGLLFALTTLGKRTEEDEKFRNFLFQLGIIIVIFGALLFFIIRGFFSLLVAIMILISIGILFLVNGIFIRNPETKKINIFRGLILFTIFLVIISFIPPY